MKATVINASQAPVYLSITAQQVNAGASKVLSGLRMDQVKQLQALSSKDIQVQTELEMIDKEPIASTMNTPANPVGGVKLLAGSGLVLKDDGVAIAYAEKIGLGVYDDAACTIPSTTATFDTATQGTIDKGTGTNRIEGTTDTSGRLTLRLNVGVARTVYTKAFPLAATSRVVDCADKHTTVFS
jgi:hypothetical protein